jgi:hypothetical protein
LQDVYGGHRRRRRSIATVAVLRMLLTEATDGRSAIRRRTTGGLSHVGFNNEHQELT